jgi:hypothetical protein
MAMDFDINFAGYEIATSTIKIKNFTGKTEDMVALILVDEAGNITADNRGALVVDKNYYHRIAREHETIHLDKKYTVRYGDKKTNRWKSGEIGPGDIKVENDMGMGDPAFNIVKDLEISGTYAADGPAFYYGVITSIDMENKNEIYTINCSDLKHYLDHEYVTEKLDRIAPNKYISNVINRWTPDTLPVAITGDGQYKGPGFRYEWPTAPNTKSLLTFLSRVFRFYKQVLVPAYDTFGTKAFQLVRLNVTTGDDVGTLVIDDSQYIKNAQVYIRPVMDGRPNAICIGKPVFAYNGLYLRVEQEIRYIDVDSKIRKPEEIKDPAINVKIAKPIKTKSHIFDATDNTNLVTPSLIKTLSGGPAFGYTMGYIGTKMYNLDGFTVGITLAGPVTANPPPFKTGINIIYNDYARTGVEIPYGKAVCYSFEVKILDQYKTANWVYHNNYIDFRWDVNNAYTTTPDGSGTDEGSAWLEQGNGLIVDKKTKSNDNDAVNMRKFGCGPGATKLTNKISTNVLDGTWRITKIGEWVFLYVIIVNANSKNTAGASIIDLSLFGPDPHGTGKPGTKVGYKIRNLRAEIVDNPNYNPLTIWDTIAQKQLSVPKYSHEISFDMHKDHPQANDFARVGNTCSLIHKGNTYNSIISGVEVKSNSNFIKVKCGNVSSNLATLFGDDEERGDDKSAGYSGGGGGGYSEGSGSGGTSNVTFATQESIAAIIDKYDD